MAVMFAVAVVALSAAASVAHASTCSARMEAGSSTVTVQEAESAIFVPSATAMLQMDDDSVTHAARAGHSSGSSDCNGFGCQTRCCPTCPATVVMIDQALAYPGESTGFDIFEPTGISPASPLPHYRPPCSLA